MTTTVQIESKASTITFQLLDPVDKDMGVFGTSLRNLDSFVQVSALVAISRNGDGFSELTNQSFAASAAASEFHVIKMSYNSPWVIVVSSAASAAVIVSAAVSRIWANIQDRRYAELVLAAKRLENQNKELDLYDKSNRIDLEQTISELLVKELKYDHQLKRALLAEIRNAGRNKSAKRAKLGALGRTAAAIRGASSALILMDNVHTDGPSAE